MEVGFVREGWRGYGDGLAELWGEHFGDVS